MRCYADLKTDQAFYADIKAIAAENGLPFSFCSQLIHTEMRDGVPIPDAMDWLKKTAPSFTGRVK